MTAVSFDVTGLSTLVEHARGCGYQFVTPDVDFGSHPRSSPVLLMRHDVDLSLRSAARLAELEAALGIRSTFFIMVRSSFYSIMSGEGSDLLRRIVDSGHALGLHWDAGMYADTDAPVVDEVIKEIDLLQWVTGAPCVAVSHHQPSLHGLADISVPGVVNMYGPAIQQSLTYLSDSCMAFRRDPSAVLDEGRSLQLLLHPEYWAPGGRDLVEVTDALAVEDMEHVRRRFTDECSLMQETVARRPQFDHVLRSTMTDAASPN